MLAAYQSLIKQQIVICEIEIVAPLDRGRKQKRSTIAGILKDLNNAFASGIHGTLFEHEEGEGICRAVIRCTGKMFRRLVEDEPSGRSQPASLSCRYCFSMRASGVNYCTDGRSPLALIIHICRMIWITVAAGACRRTTESTNVSSRFFSILHSPVPSSMRKDLDCAIGWGTCMCCQFVRCRLTNQTIAIASEKILRALPNKTLACRWIRLPAEHPTRSCWVLSDRNRHERLR